MTLRDKVTEEMKRYAPTKAYDKDHPFYYRKYSDNLFCPLGADALRAYEEGSGSETKPYIWKGHGKEVCCPPKMASIASSSAMTFNILGNGPVTISADARLPQAKHLPAGHYHVKYEKKMQTLSIGSGPANLDAFLSDDDQQAAIFCEMKLLEWLGEPGILKDSYRNKECYIAPGSYDAFYEVISAIENLQQKNPSLFKRYDVWQMFKHLLAIYNHTSFTTKDQVKDSMAGMYRQIWLLNVVNEFPAERITEDRTRRSYEKALAEEQTGASAFTGILSASSIANIFMRDCHATIEVKYMSAKDFAACLDMHPARKEYLKRYFI